MEMAQQERALAVKFDPQVKHGNREPTAVGCPLTYNIALCLIHMNNIHNFLKIEKKKVRNNSKELASGAQ